MSKEKKDALDLACEILAEHFEQHYDCADCPAHSSINSVMYCHTDNTTENCIKTIKQSLQQQADIPDGWDVVKNKIIELSKLILIANDKTDVYGGTTVFVPSGSRALLKGLIELCHEHGIEVE